MARVSRIWEAINYTSDEVKSLDMLLIDKHGHQIHARVHKSLITKFKHRIVEKEIYSMDRFSLFKSGNAYNVTSAEYIIRFKWFTSIKPVKTEITNFPEHTFLFVDFDQIPLKIDNKHLPDVVERIHLWSDLKNVTKKMDMRLPIHEPPQTLPRITKHISSQNRKTLSDIIASVNDPSSKQIHFTCEATISKILHD
ncbi:hypothetical protein IFM89_039185 [Coptis chinensis]|uniref:Replication protein A 70 kDa DNA-binding subunit B/D first OB fold domain-containing protein n=1 Tax=Coptis chinensis TaxID=261450 RepID=A0A835HBY0_9MAGN|nr:hypothetical protein IFM89_039185 [Coptis chinensis]